MEKNKEKKEKEKKGREKEGKEGRLIVLPLIFSVSTVGVRRAKS